MAKDKLTPTEIAIRAAEAAEKSAQAAARVADAVLASVNQQGEFHGYVRAHLEVQETINAQFSEVLTNHLPHLQESIGEIRGQYKYLVWGLGLVMVLIAASGILVPLFRYVG